MHKCCFTPSVCHFLFPSIPGCFWTWTCQEQLLSFAASLGIEEKHHSCVIAWGVGGDELLIRLDWFLFLIFGCCELWDDVTMNMDITDVTGATHAIAQDRKGYFRYLQMNRARDRTAKTDEKQTKTGWFYLQVMVVWQALLVEWEFFVMDMTHTSGMQPSSSFSKVNWALLRWHCFTVPGPKTSHVGRGKPKNVVEVSNRGWWFDDIWWYPPKDKPL